MTTSMLENDARRTIQSNLTGECMTFVKFGFETNDEYTLVKLRCEPGGGPPLHYHASYTERFTAIKDPFLLEKNGVKTRMTPGDSVLVDIKDVHTFTNESSEPVEFEVELRPAQRGFERGIFIAFGLQNDGLGKADGSFSNPVHAAIFLRLTDICIPGLAGSMVNGLMGGLAGFAGWMGWEKQLIEKYCSWLA